MLPAMLTLVAAVLAYDFAREMWEAVSSTVETEDVARGWRGVFPSRMVRSWTRLENDMVSTGTQLDEENIGDIVVGLI